MINALVRWGRGVDDAGSGGVMIRGGRGGGGSYDAQLEISEDAAVPLPSYTATLPTINKTINNTQHLQFSSTRLILQRKRAHIFRWQKQRG